MIKTGNHILDKKTKSVTHLKSNHFLIPAVHFTDGIQATKKTKTKTMESI